ncbi:MAG: T9SS type A sorting domain-containing protein, partial [bacterium]
GYIKGTSPGPIIGSDGNPRPGVLFMTSDMITEMGDDSYLTQFNMFLGRIDSTINLGYPLAQNTVRQPNNARALCTGDWKIVQYVDPGGIKAPQWELYCLTNDPVELINLDDYTTGEVRSDVSVPGMTQEQLIMKNALLKQQLANVTGLEEQSVTSAGLRLFQNQPNPFNRQTTVSFTIPEPGKTRLSIRDASGHEVKVLVNADLPAGAHTYTCDTGPLSPGVYLLSLDFRWQLLVKKMIVMK